MAGAARIATRMSPVLRTLSNVGKVAERETATKITRVARHIHIQAPTEEQGVSPGRIELSNRTELMEVSPRSESVVILSEMLISSPSATVRTPTAIKLSSPGFVVEGDTTPSALTTVHAPRAMELWSPNFTVVNGEISIAPLSERVEKALLLLQAGSNREGSGQAKGENSYFRLSGALALAMGVNLIAQGIDGAITDESSHEDIDAAIKQLRLTERDIVQNNHDELRGAEQQLIMELKRIESLLIGYQGELEQWVQQPTDYLSEKMQGLHAKQRNMLQQQIEELKKIHQDGQKELYEIKNLIQITHESLDATSTEDGSLLHNLNVVRAGADAAWSTGVEELLPRAGKCIGALGLCSLLMTVLNPPHLPSKEEAAHVIGNNSYGQRDKPTSLDPEELSQIRDEARSHNLKRVLAISGASAALSIFLNAVRMHPMAGPLVAVCACALAYKHLVPSPITTPRDLDGEVQKQADDFKNLVNKTKEDGRAAVHNLNSALLTFEEDLTEATKLRSEFTTENNTRRKAANEGWMSWGYQKIQRAVSSIL